MKAAALIATAFAASVAVQAEAYASSCGGSSGGGGGSGSSGGGSSGGSSGGGGDWSSSDSSSSYSSDSGGYTTSEPARPRCTDGDDPVGFRTCTRFGTWGANMRFPRLILGIGMAVRQSSSQVGGQMGHVTHDSESFTYRMVGSEGGGAAAAGSDTAVLSTFRLGVGLWKPFYVAADVELGGLASGAPAAEMTSSGMRGSPTITSQQGIAFNALGVVGARGGRGKSSFAVELAGGVRTVSYSYHSQYYACEQDVNVGAAAGMLEVRANVERWINPWVNVGAIVGSSLIDRGAWMTGLYIGVTTRAFAGER